MTESTQANRLDRALPFLIFGATAVVFLPVINWLLGQTIAHEQLTHAFLVLLLTGGLLVYERRIPLRPAFDFSRAAQNSLIASYALLLLAVFMRFNLIVLAAFCLALVAFLLFLFGRSRRRLVISSIAAFALFTGLAVLLPLLDWPLRGFAGKWSAYGLSLIGQQVELGLVRGDSGPMLILLNNGKPFHVAAECNGFGMVTSALLMAAILVLYRRLPLFDRAGWLVMALAIGLAFNTLRIIVIVLLAPLLPDERYMLMHETVGIITTYGGLAILYFLLMPRAKNPPAAAG
jgi:exosortase/archaeosortase family protein